MSWVVPVVLAALGVPALAAVSLHALRNAILARRLPRIREQLRAVFGPGANVQSARLDSRYGLEAQGVRIELASRRLVIEAERARVGGVPGLLRGQGVDALWLESWEGTLTVPGREGEPPRLLAPLRFRAEGAREPDFPVHGALAAKGAAWTHRRAEIGSPPPFDLDATIEIGVSSWALKGARASCAGASLEGELKGAIGSQDPPPALDVSARVSGIGASLLAHVLALAETDLLVTLETPEFTSALATRSSPEASYEARQGASESLHHRIRLPANAEASLPGLRLPRDLTVKGEVGLRPDFSRRAALALETPSTKLDLDAKVDPRGALEGSTLEGTLSFADADTCRIFPSDLRPTREGAMSVDARLEGELSHPVLAGSARTPSVELAWASRPDLPRFPFAEASVSVRLDRERLAWSSLEARGMSGRFTGDGIFHLDAVPVSRETHVAFEGVRVEEIQLGSAATPISRVLSARASGEIRGKGQGPSLERSTAEGVLRLDDPEYRFLSWANDSLSGFGLPALPAKGIGPCRARIAMAKGKIQLADIDGAVSGVKWRGSVATTFAGELTGSFQVELEPSYLKRSLLLVFPAAFAGAIDVPITVSGKLGKPDFKADVIGALSGLLAKDPLEAIETVAAGLGGAVEGIVEGFFGIFDDSPRRPRRSRARGSELERIFDRILENGPDATRLKMELLASGISPSDLDRLIEEHRRKRRARS